LGRQWFAFAFLVSVIGDDYPGPIVDHADARREALARYRV
jgi:hypothetical protein